MRHEVTHALLDGALAKPADVGARRRGGVLRQPVRKAGERPARVPCPSDAELLRPLSAGAQREAYARAEACFARAIADGKRWDQVK